MMQLKDFLVHKMKHLPVLAGILAIGVIEFLMYWNSHLYYRAAKAPSIEKKIKSLERANLFYPLNDQVFYELGKAYSDLGSANLDNETASKAYLQKSILNFQKSLKINPAHYFSHFYYAQAQLYNSIVYSSPDISYLKEFKKAIQLAGENRQIFFEAGKIFLSQWPQLSKKDKDFTVDTLKKISWGTDRENLQAIMEIWAANVQDYEVMEKILPEEPIIYWQYAQFLGEKSLSLEVRQKLLARSDYFEFEKAMRDYSLGEREFSNFRMGQASRYFKSSLDKLERIKFYQKLTQQNFISLSEFKAKYQATLLNLAKSLIEQGKGFPDVETYLRKYLSLEIPVGEVKNLESYLVKREVIGENLEDARDDLDLFSFQLFLYFKENRYRDIIKAERLFQDGGILIPERKREKHTEILLCFGDALQKSFRLYEAESLYLRALEIDPYNLRSLIKCRENYQKMNDDLKLGLINERIRNLLSPERLSPKDSLINKGKSYSQTLVLDGSKIQLELQFKNQDLDLKPLINVVFNDNIIWEDYLSEEVLILPLETLIGANTLVITAVNKAISFIEIKLN